MTPYKLMPNYELGKIYKIWDNEFKKCYIGSTIDKLSSRMGKHRSGYNHFLNDVGPNIRVYDLFQEFGVENCKIELLEEYSCKNRGELEAREGYHQRNNECVNKNIAGRKNKEYNDDHKEEHKQYYDKNKDKILQYQKDYSKENKDKIKIQKQIYGEKNKIDIAVKKKSYYQENKAIWEIAAAEVVLCECGCEIRKPEKSRHIKTNKHNKLMEQKLKI